MTANQRADSGPRSRAKGRPGNARPPFDQRLAHRRGAVEHQKSSQHRPIPPLRREHFACRHCRRCRRSDLNRLAHGGRETARFDLRADPVQTARRPLNPAYRLRLDFETWKHTGVLGIVQGAFGDGARFQLHVQHLRPQIVLTAGNEQIVDHDRGFVQTVKVVVELLRERRSPRSVSTRLPDRAADQPLPSLERLQRVAQRSFGMVRKEDKAIKIRGDSGDRYRH